MEDTVSETKPSTYSFLFWSNFAIQDAHAVEEAISVRNAEDFPSSEHQGVVLDFDN
jgi:hypothetical protein